MRVGFKEPNKPMVYKDVKNDIEILRDLVGGYIEPFYYGDVVLLMNEEGWLKGLPYNFTLDGVDISGNVVILSQNGDEFVDVGELSNVLLEILNCNV